MTNIWFRLNKWAKIPQLTWWQKSVASTSLEESEKKVHELQCKKTNRQQAGESQHCALRYRQSQRPQSVNFLDDYDEADEGERRRLSPAISKRNYETPALRKSTFGSSLWWQPRKKTNCLLHFRVLNLKNFSTNPAVMGFQEQTMINRLNNCQVSFIFSRSKRTPVFKTAV